MDITDKVIKRKILDFLLAFLLDPNKKQFIG